MASSLRQPLKAPLDTTSSKQTEQTDEERLAHRTRQRQRQIELGYNTVAYHNYAVAVPKRKRARREPSHPVTPDAAEPMSKRKFDGRVRAWKMALHDNWGPNRARAASADASELTAIATASTAHSSAAPPGSSSSAAPTPTKVAPPSGAEIGVRVSKKSFDDFLESTLGGAIPLRSLTNESTQAGGRGQPRSKLQRVEHADSKLASPPLASAPAAEGVDSARSSVFDSYS